VKAPSWRRARVAQVDSGDRVVVLRLDGIAAETAPVALDGVARALWDLLVEPRTCDELLDGLRAIWPDHELSASELTGFLDDLVAAGVLDVSRPSEATG
jgi:hypothetical protein